MMPGCLRSHVRFTGALACVYLVCVMSAPANDAQKVVYTPSTLFSTLLKSLVPDLPVLQQPETVTAPPSQQPGIDKSQMQIQKFEQPQPQPPPQQQPQQQQAPQQQQPKFSLAQQAAPVTAPPTLSSSASPTSSLTPSPTTSSTPSSSPSSPPSPSPSASLPPSTPFFSLLPPTSTHVQLSNIVAIHHANTPVYTQCEDDGSTATNITRQGTVTSVNFPSNTITITWSSDSTPTSTSTRTLCHTCLYTSREEAAMSKCKARAPMPLLSTALPMSTAVKGWVDTHVHMFAERGALGRLMWGSADGDLATVMKQCDGKTSHGLGMFPKFPDVAQIVRRALDCDGKDFETHISAREGYPSFHAWPRWNDVVHHQAHVTWLKKAFQDGLRITVISVVSNELVCEFSEIVGSPPRPDLPSTCQDLENNLAQLKRAREVIAANADWMELALSSKQAKEIVESGKLAVVLAVESGDILLTRKPAQSVADWVRDSLNVYYQEGVRSIQIVHEFSNDISGASVQKEIYNLLRDVSSLSGNGAPGTPLGKLAAQYLNQQTATSTTTTNENTHDQASLSPASPELTAASTTLLSTETTATNTATTSSSSSSTEQLIAELSSSSSSVGINLDPASLSAVIRCPTHAFGVWQKLAAWAQKHQDKLNGFKVEHDSETNVDYNTIGLSGIAKEFVSQALGMGMMVDAAHLSRPAGADLAKLYRDEFHAPYFVSHGFFSNKFEHTDYNLDAKVVSWILESGGMVGLRTVFTEFPSPPFSRVANDCDGSVKTYLQAYQLALALGLPPAMASDFNGLAINLAPRFGSPEETCSKPWIREGCLTLAEPPSSATPEEQQKYKEQASICDQLRERRDAQRAAQGDVQTHGTRSAYDVKGLASLEFLGRVIDDSVSLGMPMDDIYLGVGRFIDMWNRFDHAISQAGPPKDVPSPEVVSSAFKCWCADCK